MPHVKFMVSQKVSREIHGFVKVTREIHDSAKGVSRGRMEEELGGGSSEGGARREELRGRSSEGGAQREELESEGGARSEDFR